MLAGIAAGILAAGATEASAASVKVGVLDCRVAPGVGLIIGSSKRLACTFTPTGRKARESATESRPPRVAWAPVFLPPR